jgi:hypothetical protein
MNLLIKWFISTTIAAIMLLLWRMNRQEIVVAILGFVVTRIWLNQEDV